ncbi:MAG: hypothetical protein EPO22_13825 [Dehalococcoidia bacterium]|nr:MAG: hypothetical protein EPO22_13825 [Dehalococcoidia bacterium]
MKRLSVVLTDVTEMSGDNVCIAGVDLASGRTVRLSDRTPTRRMLAGHGGLRPGDVVDVKFDPMRRPEAPHVEDGRWDHLTLHKARVMPFDELHALLGRRAFRSVEEAFGRHAVMGRNGNHGWKRGTGARSLATLRATDVRATLSRDTLRVEFTDGAGVTWTAAPFQDLAVKTHPASCEACRCQHLPNVAAEFDAGEALLRIGLTREFAPSGGPGGCWLQVTNIIARPREHF